MENPTIESLQVYWNSVIENLKKENPTTSEKAVIRTKCVYPIKITDNLITFGYRFTPHARIVQDGTLLKDYLEEFFKYEVVIDFKQMQYFTEEDRKKAEEEKRKIEQETQEENARRKEIERYNLLEKRKQNSRIPAHAFIDENFDNLKITEENKRIIEKCKEFSTSDNRNYWFLTLSGKTGIAKTHLAFAVGIEAIKNKTVQYWHVGELLDAFHRGQFDSSYATLMDELKEIGLLILDDYGDFKDTEFKTEKLDILIDSRYENRMDTIFTTNKTLKELGDLNQRIASRLTENLFIPIKCDDYRINLSKNKIQTHPNTPLVRGKYVANYRKV